MSDLSNRRARGIEKIEEIARMSAFDPQDAFAAATIDSVFGELWQRPGLPVRERRLLSLATVGTRGLEFEAAKKAGGEEVGRARTTGASVRDRPRRSAKTPRNSKVIK